MGRVAVGLGASGELGEGGLKSPAWWEDGVFWDGIQAVGERVVLQEVFVEAIGPADERAVDAVEMLAVSCPMVVSDGETYPSGNCSSASKPSMNVEAPSWSRRRMSFLAAQLNLCRTCELACAA